MGELTLSSVLRELRILLTYSRESEVVGNSKQEPNLAMGWGPGRGPTRGFPVPVALPPMLSPWQWAPSASGYPCSCLLAPPLNPPHEQNIASGFTESIFEHASKNIDRIKWHWVKLEMFRRNLCFPKRKKQRETLIMFPGEPQSIS